MFRDILEILQEFFKRVVTSRVFVLGALFTAMFCVLAVKLFNLQIINGERYLTEYVSKTLRTVYTPGSRGNIYDRNGKVLAYNELAYSVTIRNNGDYSTNQERNLMLLKLVRILDAHDETVEGELEITIDQNGEVCLHLFVGIGPAAVSAGLLRTDVDGSAQRRGWFLSLCRVRQRDF